MQTLEELASEVAFWRDFIIWWEEKYATPAQGRLLQALENAEARYREAYSGDSLLNYWMH